MKNILNIANIKSIKKAFYEQPIKKIVYLNSFLPSFNLIKKYVKNTSQVNSIPICLMNGIIHKDNEDCYSMIVDNNDEIDGIYVRMDNKDLPVKINIKPVILISNHRLNDEVFINSLIIHEFAHFIKNHSVGESESEDYASDPDEIFSRNMERKLLKEFGMSQEQTEKFLNGKYFVQ